IIPYLQYITQLNPQSSTPSTFLMYDLESYHPKFTDPTVLPSTKKKRRRTAAKGNPTPTDQPRQYGPEYERLMAWVEYKSSRIRPHKMHKLTSEDLESWTYTPLLQQSLPSNSRTHLNSLDNNCNVIDNDSITQTNSALITGDMATNQANQANVIGNFNHGVQLNSALITNNLAANAQRNGIAMGGNISGDQTNIAGIVGNRVGA
ncbi:hypothetical protein HDV05_005473, partial [Chytridiales sp. JEL 0842]